MAPHEGGSKVNGGSVPTPTRVPPTAVLQARVQQVCDKIGLTQRQQDALEAAARMRATPWKAPLA